MSLRQLVNDRDLYGSLLEEFTRRLSLVHKSMTQASDVNELLRLQGEARAITRLLNLKEKVNDG